MDHPAAADLAVPDGPVAPVQPAPGDPALDLRRVRALERIAAVLGWTAGVLAVVAFVATLADVCLLVFAAVLVAVLLRGGAEGLHGLTRLPVGLCLLAIVLALLSVFGLLGWLYGPRLAAEGVALWDQINTQFQALWGRFGDLDWVRRLADRLRGYFSGEAGRLAGLAAGVATSTLGAFGSLLVVAVVALYLAASPRPYVRGTVRLLPHGWRPRGSLVMTGVAHALRWWFVGQAVDMAVIGVLTFVGLTLLGVKLAVVLAIVAGLFNFVPYVGAIAGAVPAVLVAFGGGPQQALYVAGLFVAVQALEGNVIAPFIQRRTVDLPPVLTLLSQTVLGTLLGPLGLILATPLTAAGMVAVERIYVEGVLGDRVERDQ